MAIHLWTSPTVVDPDIDDLVVSPVQLAVAPVSVLVGYGIPSFIMCLAAPTWISFEAKQAWAGIQQAWPVWIAIAQALISSSVAVINPMVSVETEDKKKEKTLKYLRQAYLFAVLSSVTGHLTSWGLSLLAYIFPVLFSAGYLPMLQPSRIFKPAWPFPPARADTLADGALWFLQWDSLTGTSAVFLWALTLRIAAKKESGTLPQWILGLVKMGVLVVALGPAGAGVVAMWGRDELVFRRWAEEKDKSREKKRS